MRADEKWPEFMRGDGDSEEEFVENERDADEAELHLDLDSLTADDLSPPGGRRRRTRAGGRKQAKAKRSGGRIVPLALMGLAVLCLLGGGFYGYKMFFGGRSDAEPPLVQAMDDPVKVKPESPGGLQVPFQDQEVMHQSEGEFGQEPTVERLLPPPEQPQLPPRPAETAETMTPASEAATAALPPLESQEVIEAPEPKEPVAIEAPVPRQDEILTIQTTENSRSATATLQEPAPGTYLLQLGSFTSSGFANAAWEKLQGSHPALLGDMSLFVQEATVDGKSYYRVQTGPFPNRATAVDLCAQLKVEKQDCLVVRR